ncbi:hypothetical protein VTO73DRAFT_1954 [Trametes versicolor]
MGEQLGRRNKNAEVRNASQSVSITRAPRGPPHYPYRAVSAVPLCALCPALPLLALVHNSGGSPEQSSGRSYSHKTRHAAHTTLARSPPRPSANTGRKDGHSACRDLLPLLVLLLHPAEAYSSPFHRVIISSPAQVARLALQSRSQPPLRLLPARPGAAQHQGPGVPALAAKTQAQTRIPRSQAERERTQDARQEGCQGQAFPVALTGGVCAPRRRRVSLGRLPPLRPVSHVGSTSTLA